MSDCKDQKYNIFNPSFSDETGNEVVDDPVTGSASAPIVVDVDAYDSIGDGTGVAKLTSSLGSSRLDITTTGAVTLGFTASSNTMNIDAPIYVTSGSDGRLAYYDGAGSQVNDAIDLYYDDINKRLGIQTLAPSASLTVSGSDDTKLFLVESDSNTNILDVSVDVSGSGHVGINTAAGNAALTINSNDSNVAHFKRENAANYLEIRNQSTTNGAILNAIDTDLAFWHNYSETARMYEGGRMRFSSSAGGSSVEITGSGTGALLGVHSETKDNILYVAATGSIGIGTGTPGTVFETSYSANVLQIKGRGNHVQLQLESQGSGYPAILMADGSGTTNTRTAFLQVAGDVFKLRSLQDNSATRVDNIIVADLDNGYVAIGTSSATRTLSVNGGASFYGDVDITGTLTADKIVVSTTYVTSSIMFTSGSTKFGDTDDDTHQFTGSILVNGLLSSSSGISASNLYLPKAGKLIFNSDASANNYFTADNTDDYVRLIMNNQTILTATDPGYIGINTSSPTANLEVTGTVNISGSVNEQVMINDVAVGRGRKQGHRNTALGESALDEGTSSFGHNTAIGWWSQKNNPNGKYNTSVGASTLPNSTGYFNTTIGAYSLSSLSSGHSNTTAGYLAGSDLTSGFRNTLLGYNSKGPVDGYNMTAIGYAASASAQNEFVVGNSSITKLYNMGDNTSDLGQNSNRWKNLYVGSTLKVSGSSARLEITGSDNSTLFGVHSATNSNILTVESTGAEIYVNLGTPTDFADFDSYQLVVKGGSSTGNTSGVLLTTTETTGGGSAIVHHDSGSWGKGNLSLYTKRANTATAPIETMRLGADGITRIFGPGGENTAAGPTDLDDVVLYLDNKKVTGNGTHAAILEINTNGSNGSSTRYSIDGTFQATVGSTGTGDLRLATRAGNNKDIYFSPNSVETARFATGGNATIGSATTNAHTINGSLQSTGDYPIHTFATTSGAFRLRSSGLNDLFYVKDDGKVGIGTSNPSYELDVGGTIQCTTLIETSARQLKEDITPQKSELNNIMKLNPVDFNWKKDNKKSKGFIAEEVQEVYPELVAKNKDGKATGIEYAKMVSVLTQGMKELNKMVAKQQETIERLVKKIEGKS